MSGRPGRSGGGNRIDPRLHVLRGTFRPERHAQLLASSDAVWQPTPAQLAVLGPDGQALITRVLTTYTVRVVEGEFLLEAAHATDRLAHLRQALLSAEQPDRLKLERAEQQWQRQLLSCLQAMKVER
jgi:hypothetical protein